MDFCDINVRVLYDFEYTTKYGRNIKITSGERLLLIKKTNDDWWQVIRSTDQRPFFVPASYVQEIVTSNAAISQNQSKTKCSLEKTALKRNNSSSSSSLNENLSNVQIYENLNPDVLAGKSSNLTKPTEKANLKKDISGNCVTTTNMTISSTMSSSGYNSFSDELPVFDEENAIISSGNSHTMVDNGKCYSVSQARFDNSLTDVICNPPVPDKLLSAEDKMPSIEVLVKSHTLNENSKYSKVSNPSPINYDQNTSKVMSNIPASDSLENLTLQIELKTNLLRTIPDKSKTFEPKIIESNCNPDKYDDLIFSNYEIESQPQEKTVVVLSDEKYQESKLSDNIIGSLPHTSANNYSLNYQGSFKTNKEKERYLTKSSSEKHLRRFLSEGGEDVKLPKCTENVSAQDLVVNNSVYLDDVKSYRDNCNVSKLDKSRIYQWSNENLEPSNIKKVTGRRHYSFGNDGQMSTNKNKKEKTTSLRSLDSVLESELIDTIEEFQQKNKAKGYLPPSDTIISHDKNSEKSSTDSLLDVEYGNKHRNTSCGTSDSIVPTDGEDLISSNSEVDSVDHPSKFEDSYTSDGVKHKRKPLSRNRRVISKSKINTIEDTPPSPGAEQVPTRSLGEDWNEFNTEDGRTYFYNYKTKERSWKPPRKTNVVSDDMPEDMFVVSLPLPSGWRSDVDADTGQTCYINLVSGAKWFSSTDGEGRVYFFEENSNNSSWNLPENISDSEIAEDKSLDKSKSPVAEKSLNRNAKAKSLILATRDDDHVSLSNLYHNWPKLRHGGSMCILKEGPLNKTKITEHGKKVRKNWSSTHAVLTELQLLFFKDNKGFALMMNGTGGPEISVELNGAIIYSGEKVSSRKHVYMLSTVLGLQVLIQTDCAAVAEDWLAAIQGAIDKLPLRSDANLHSVTSGSPTEDNKLSHIKRSRSLKVKHKSASIEDMSANIERQTKIRERLKKFFHRRPTVDLLVKKGIWKDEPVFGCLLEHACKPDSPRVPEFVQRCIDCIERSQENMKADGLYRASGNLSQVQKIRLQVDQNIYSLLEQEEDVHVLAGALKLFFRELKQPLIPFKFFSKALRASTDSNRSEKIKELREIVKALPPCNHDTLKLLLQHLLSVSKYQDHNRMHIPNIAIVFGPTLMWSEQESTDMAFDLMQQNLVIECFLSDFHAIFH